MKNLYMIAAIGKNRELGVQGDLVWRLKNDMKFFRETTLGSIVVMGGRTWESLPNGALKDRENLVLSRSLEAADGAKVFKSKDELDAYLSKADKPIFVIGGASLYGAYLPEAERLYLTEIDDSEAADVYFPEFQKSDYERKVLRSGEEDGVKYQMVEYTRKGNND